MCQSLKWDWKILKQPRRGAERSNPSIVIVTSEALATNLGGLGLDRVESDFAKNIYKYSICKVVRERIVNLCNCEDT